MCEQSHRGFESLSLRHEKSAQVVWPGRFLVYEKGFEDQHSVVAADVTAVGD